MRLAVWSGPRNLSTALMYSFAQRPDCTVRDEPFYAAYLAATGLRHPLRDAVLAAGQTDPAAVADDLCRDPGPGRIAYQKHMVHHLLPAFPTRWMAGCAHVLLIRHPARVAASYTAKRAAPDAHDLGFPQQAFLLDLLAGLGQRPVIIDAGRLRADPAGVLARLCRTLGVSPCDRMLSWVPGPKPYDGAWAPHWYDAVHRSTGFAPPEGPLPRLDGPLMPLIEAALPAYQTLLAEAL